MLAVSALVARELPFAARSQVVWARLVVVPGNGGLLYAVAMMAAGWDGRPARPAELVSGHRFTVPATRGEAVELQPL